MGWKTLARAEDVEKLRSEVKTMQLDALEQRIYDTQRLWCSAPTADSKRFYRGEIARMHRNYFMFTGVTVDVPTCKELGVDGD